MSMRCWRAGRTFVLLPVLLLLAAGLSAAMPTKVSAAPRADCVGPVAGRHIYDCANLLTTAEIANLEAQAAAVERAGAPTVVYLQVRDATAEQTLSDAIDLMNRWNVESRPGAHDGFVMLFDLRPGDLRHGQVALYAGEKHYQHGNLPQAELDRIRTDVMTPLLQNEQTAAGIAAGLQMVAHDLQYGPPPPPAYRVAAVAIGRIPFNVLAALFAIAMALLLVRVRRQPPMSSAAGEVGLGPLASLASLASPGELPPAEAGALIKGRIADAQIEATILDFAQRGLLVLEPAGDTKARIRLVGEGRGLSGYERDVWNELATQADDGRRTISNDDLAALRAGWGGAKAHLRRELIERGWYDPDAAATRRRPLYIAGALGMVGAAAALLLIILSQEGWATIGLVIFLVAGVGAFVRGYQVPDTTVEGEIAAAPWRGYRESVMDRAYEPKLDTDLPYIVALEIVGKLAPRLKAASERGYSPSWFRAGRDTETRAGGGRMAQTVGFYPYWIVFHSAVTPASHGSAGGSASGGYSGAGAAGGGGGSSGGF
ncbi:MAG TPA: TPM domain-containing protein [Ktedonobacterales bacterium]|nr:TPM domain-containing protein [Ktedonobacterales bacterium]